MKIIKKIIYLLTLFCFSFGYSQDLKKISKNHDDFYEIYYVLKTDGKVKEGNYKKINYDNKLLEEGNYVNNQKVGVWRVYYPLKKKPLRYIGNYKDGLKDSLWVGYHEDGKIYSQGHYTGGQRSGTWEFFDKDGRCFQKYNYDERSVILNNDSSFFPFELLGNMEIDTGKVIPPFYIGGSKDFLYEWRKINVKLPRIEGELNETILVGIFVNEEGRIQKYSIEQGIYYDMNQAALEVVKSLPINWHPAELNGLRLKTKILVDVNFRNYFVPVRFIPRVR